MDVRCWYQIYILMLRFILLAFTQCILISSGQLLLKFAMNKMPKFAWTKDYWGGLFTNIPFVCSGICVLSGTILWMHILKHYDFSLAYPVSSLSYVIGMFAAALLLHETIPYTRWIGVCFILIGIFFMVKQ